MSLRREWQQGRVGGGGSGCERELRRQLQDKDELLRQMEKSMRRSMSAVHRGTPAPPSAPAPRSAQQQQHQPATTTPTTTTTTEPDEAAAAASAYGSGDDVVLRVVSELHSLRQLVSDVIGVSRDEQAARRAENVVGRLEVLEQASRTQELRAKALEDRVAELERKAAVVDAAAASPPPPLPASSGGVFLPPGFLDPLEGRVEALERLADEDGEASAAAAALSLSRLTTLEHASGILADKLESAEAAQEGLAAQQGKVEEALATLYNLQKRTEKAVAAAAAAASAPASTGASSSTIRTGTPPPPAAARATRPQARRTPPTTPKVAVEAVVREQPQQQGGGGGGSVSLSLPVPSTPLPASPSAAHLNATPHSARSIASVSRTGGRQQQQRQQPPTSAGTAAAAASDNDDGSAGRFTIALSTGEFVVGV